MSDERIKVAYYTFRGGFRGDAPCPVPHWDDAPDWVRDVATVAYLQGKLDSTGDEPVPTGILSGPLDVISFASHRETIIRVRRPNGKFQHIAKCEWADYGGQQEAEEVANWFAWAISRRPAIKQQTAPAST